MVVVNKTTPVTEVTLEPDSDTPHPNVQFTVSFYDIQEVDVDESILFDNNNKIKLLLLN